MLPQKIGLLLIDIGKQYGGIEKYVENVGEYFLQHGYRVYFCIRKGGTLESKLRKMKAVQPEHIITIDGNRKLYRQIAEIKSFAVQNDIDIVHSNGVGSLFLGTILTRGMRHITTVHGDAAYDRKERGRLIAGMFAALEALLLKKVLTCIAVSGDLAEKLLKKGVKREHITIIPNGIELLTYEMPEQKSKDKFKICAVGRLEPIKGYQYLIMAVADLLKQNPEMAEKLECDIYGKGSEEKQLQELIKKLGIEDCVRLRGFSDDIRGVYPEYDVFVQPSLYESFGISVLEAMNAGNAVIVTGVGGMKEFVRDNENGMMIEAKNRNALSRKLNLLYRDAALRKRLSETAMHDVQQYDREVLLHRLEEVYKKVVEK